ncbi:hypothetical protein B296_00058610, partial [Ensete ventricosum]
MICYTKITREREREIEGVLGSLHATHSSQSPHRYRSTCVAYREPGTTLVTCVSLTTSFLSRKTAKGSNSQRRVSIWSQFLFLLSQVVGDGEREAHKVLPQEPSSPNFMEIRKKEREADRGERFRFRFGFGGGDLWRPAGRNSKGRSVIVCFSASTLVDSSHNFHFGV